jgi:hypothetical protein
MNRKYIYVGPPEIAAAVMDIPPGVALCSPADVLAWIKEWHHEFDRSRRMIATFVVDESGNLRVAERRSEHVACAGGGPVLAAGEITVRLFGSSVEAEEVTNQSTGYCPEPESWNAVAEALSRAGVAGPAGYTSEFVFRLCEKCHQINLVKEQVFECAACGSDLPVVWNFG